VPELGWFWDDRPRTSPDLACLQGGYQQVNVSFQQYYMCKGFLEDEIGEILGNLQNKTDMQNI